MSEDQELRPWKNKAPPHTRLIVVFPSSCSVVSSMKEAQEKLTGDAFKRGHTGDEL